MSEILRQNGIPIQAWIIDLVKGNMPVGAELIDVETTFEKITTGSAERIIDMVYFKYMHNGQVMRSRVRLRRQQKRRGL